jgi:hypothetical protein
MENSHLGCKKIPQCYYKNSKDNCVTNCSSGKVEMNEICQGCTEISVQNSGYCSIIGIFL